MRRLALVLTCVSFAAMGGCKKSGGDAKKGATTAEAPAEAGKPPAPAAAPAPAPAPAAEVKAEYKPDEAWTTLNGMSRMDVMDKFKDGMTVTGTVAKVNEDPAGEYGVELDAGGGNVIELRFADFGKAGKDKKLAAGAAVSATKCAPTNAQGSRLALVQCELK